MWVNSLFYVIVVQSPSHIRLFMTPWTEARQASLSFTISQSLPKFMSIALVMPSTYLILWNPLLLSIIPRIRVFSSELAILIRWPKYLSFSFNISPFSDYSGLISFKIDWFDLLAVQGALQFQSINSLALYLLYVKVSQPYVTTGKTIALTIQTFVVKVMSLLF